jgi:DNA repair exonuclease SbcCD ATPase subunit
MDEKYVYVNEVSIDPELICNICKEPFNDPCCTSCDETFCRKCITYWIQNGNGSCPHCRQTLTINALRQVPRPLKSMLDRLQVKCIVCGQTELERGNFNNHIEKLCPKMIVSCSSADIKCLWTGQRDQLTQHLADCPFESMKSVITQLTVKNKELKYRANQCSIQRTGQQNEIKQIKEQVNQNKTRIDAQQNENQPLKYQITGQAIQITEQQNQIQQLIEQVDQQKIQIGKYHTEKQHLKDQVIRLRSELTEKRNNQGQMAQQKVEIDGHQNWIRKFSNLLKRKPIPSKPANHQPG